jgi:hypothetical protein
MRKQNPQQESQAPPKSKSKAGKKQKNLYLSDQARQLLSVFSLNMGICETAVVELLIREKATRGNVALPQEKLNDIN